MRRSSQLVALLAVGSALESQAPRRVDLTAPEALLSRPFIRITALRELPDGRVLVADDHEVEVVLADFRAQSADLVGRRGQGPQEFLLPRGLIPLPGGRTLLQDPGNARFLEFDAKGQIVRSIAPQLAASSSGSNMMLGLSTTWDIRGSDRRGSVYFDQTPAPLRPGETATVPIVRWDTERRVLDTVASYRVSEAMQSQSVQGGKPGEVLVRPRAWTARAQWAVAPDGRIAIAEPDPYRVVWIDDSGRHPGPAVAFTAQPVTSADREGYVNEMNAAQTRDRGRRGAPEPRRPGANPNLKRAGAPIFPTTFPVFVGRESVHIDPDGAVWVARAHGISEASATYDVFDAHGRRQATAQLRPLSRIVAFGERAIYIARRDSDDLEHLERYRR